MATKKQTKDGAARLKGSLFGAGKSTAQTKKEEKSTISSFSSAQGTPELIPFEKIRKNPLNTGNDKTEETIESLAISIETLGLLESPIVYKADDGTYVLIAGEGRYCAIERLREKKPCFDEILCIVKPKPETVEEEKIWIISSNEQRNPASLERTRSNIRSIIQNAQDLSSKGYGKFESLIKGMTLLKRSSIFQYKSINENLISEFQTMFDEESINVQTAYDLSRLSHAEQLLIMNKYVKQGVLHYDRSEIDAFIKTVRDANDERVNKVDEYNKELKKKNKEISRLEKAMSELQDKYENLKNELIENEDEDALAKTTKELRKVQKQNKKKEEELEESRKKASLLEEQLRRAEEYLPSIPDAEMEKIKKQNELYQLMGSMETLQKRLKKKAEEYRKIYGQLPDDLHIEL